jgi:hypothetical protein
LSESEDLPEIPDVIAECNANKGKSRAVQDADKVKESDKELHSDSTYPYICIKENSLYPLGSIVVVNSPRKAKKRKLGYGTGTGSALSVLKPSASQAPAKPSSKNFKHYSCLCVLNVFTSDTGPLTRSYTRRSATRSSSMGTPVAGPSRALRQASTREPLFFRSPSPGPILTSEPLFIHSSSPGPIPLGKPQTVRRPYNY